MIDTISDTSLKKHTGKVWKDWISILNTSGAQNWSHQEIVQFLKRKHKQSLWWQQMIANGYEVATGKRISGQSLKGTYSVTGTKTISVEAKKLWKWVISENGIAHWLNPLTALEVKPGACFEVAGGIFGEIRTVKPGTRIRMTWKEEEWEKTTTLQVHVYPRPKGKCMLVIQHDGLRTAKQKTDFGQRWRKVLEEVALLFKDKTL